MDGDFCSALQMEIVPEGKQKLCLKEMLRLKLPLGLQIVKSLGNEEFVGLCNL